MEEIEKAIKMMAMNLEHLSKGQIHEELAFMTEKAKRDIIA